MDPSNHLQSLLQIQLASDASAVRHLPYCLSTLNKECLKPSAQSTKWTNRINSLLHSKESGARWAGLCLAYKSSCLSQKLMIDAAQSWISFALPLLSVRSTLSLVYNTVAYLFSREMNPFLLSRPSYDSWGWYSLQRSTFQNFTDKYLYPISSNSPVLWFLLRIAIQILN